MIKSCVKKLCWSNMLACPALCVLVVFGAVCFSVITACGAGCLDALHPGDQAADGR